MQNKYYSPLANSFGTPVIQMIAILQNCLNIGDQSDDRGAESIFAVAIQDHRFSVRTRIIFVSPTESRPLSYSQRPAVLIFRIHYSR